MQLHRKYDLDSLVQTVNTVQTTLNAFDDQLPVLKPPTSLLIPTRVGTSAFPIFQTQTKPNQQLQQTSLQSVAQMRLE